MMQRWLRSRWLYMLLILLTVFLYARTREITWPEPAKPRPTSTSSHDTLSWWPSELDGEKLRVIAVKEPELMLAMSALSICVAGISVLGILLGLWTAWNGRLERIWRFRSRHLPSWSAGELGRVMLLVVIVALLMPFVRIAFLPVWDHHDFDPHFWVTSSMLILDLFVILMVLAFAVPKGSSVWTTLVGPAESLPKAISVGIRGYIAAFPWIFLLLFVMVELTQWLGWKPPMEPIQELVFEERRPFVLGMTMLLACVVGPVAEECFFRGVLYPVLRRRLTRAMSMLLSGAIFALVHTNPVGFIPIMALGYLLANLYDRTGSLVSPVLVHMLHNSVLLSFGLILRELMAVH